MDRYEEVVRQMIADGQISQEVAEKYFPELKESEDERIKKLIISSIKEDKVVGGTKTKEQCIAWLEKQANHAKFCDSIQVGDKVTRNEDGVLVNLSQLSRVAKPADKVEPKFKVGDIIHKIGENTVYPMIIERITEETYVCNDERVWVSICMQDKYELVEQKPTEWSEEDKKHFKSIMKELENQYQRPVNEPYRDIIASDINWLKSLRPQPKQEWSKEDIDMIDCLIRCCEKEHADLCNDKYGHQEIVSDLKRDCRKKWDWLQSLKNKVVPQKQWKPSEEQIYWLKWAANRMPDTEKANEAEAALRELLEQLKEQLNH